MIKDTCKFKEDIKFDQVNIPKEVTILQWWMRHLNTKFYDFLDGVYDTPHLYYYNNVNRRDALVNNNVSL